MKPVKLVSLVHAKTQLSPSVFELYLSNFDINIKEHEYSDLQSLVDDLQTHSPVMDVFDVLRRICH